MRVEFSRSLRPNTSRFVLMIEIPDNVASELKARKVSHETRAYFALRENKPSRGFCHECRLDLVYYKEPGLKAGQRFHCRRFSSPSNAWVSGPAVKETPKEP
jgi:hypothetical protein